MNWEECVSKTQKFLSEPPLIVLGSGATVPYELPSMAELGDEIQKDDAIRADPGYSIFVEKMKSAGLEAAMSGDILQPKTNETIREITWELINERDFAYLRSNGYSGPPTFQALLKKITKASSSKAIVVTTNYDRLVEYAADSIGAFIVNGFKGTYIQKFALLGNQLHKKRNSRERVVYVWKVHGSLDWFCDANGNYVSLPFSKEIPKEFQPLIVPPSTKKYYDTHNDPYRSIITEADKSFQSANSYLCVGYGFNDEHVQPKLIEQVKCGKKIVILTKETTKACKGFIDMVRGNCIAFESGENNCTQVSYNGENMSFDGEYWKLEEFLKIW